ncbi:MAG: hypothetical protein GWP15_01620 [Nitrospirae bacterium]|nr:hypothetical protein [Nitrospirota bacterium]
MKKLLLLVITAILISGCVAQEEPAPADDVSDVPTSNVYGDWDDEGSGITFEYPLDWAVYSLEGEGTLFHKDSDVLADWEGEGSLVYRVIYNSEDMELKDYLDAEYEECMAQEMPEGSAFGPMCGKMDIESWESTEVADYPAYISERRGMPESGETAKDMYVVVENDDYNHFIYIRSVGTGIAMQNNGDFIESVFDTVVETLTIHNSIW